MPKKTKLSVLESEMGVVPPDAPRLAELEAKLEAGNAALESAAAALDASRKPEQVPAVLLPHPLEMAPINSKIVVTTDGAVLAMPNEEAITLVRPDPAARLAVGAKISKTLSSEGETFYVATLLNSERPEEPSFHGSAIEAIQQFPEIHYNR